MAAGAAISRGGGYLLGCLKYDGEVIMGDQSGWENASARRASRIGCVESGSTEPDYTGALLPATWNWLGLRSGEYSHSGFLRGAQHLLPASAKSSAD